MFDAQLIIDRISSVTGFTVGFSKSKEVTLTEFTDLPTVTVGYGSVDSENPTTPEAFNGYELHGESLIQVFDIHIVCLVSNLPTTWRAVYKSLVTYNPLPLEDQFSGLTYKQGGVIGIENDRLRHLDRWSIAFPSMSPFV